MSSSDQRRPAPTNGDSSSGPERAPPVGEGEADQRRVAVAAAVQGQSRGGGGLGRAVGVGDDDHVLLLVEAAARRRDEVEAIEVGALPAARLDVEAERALRVSRLGQVVALDPHVELQAADPAERVAERADALVHAVERRHQLVVRLVAVDQLADRALAARDLAGDLVEIVHRGLDPAGDLAQVRHRLAQIAPVLTHHRLDLGQHLLDLPGQARQLLGERGAEALEVGDRATEAAPVLGDHRAQLVGGRPDARHQVPEGASALPREQPLDRVADLLELGHGAIERDRRAARQHGALGQERRPGRTGIELHVLVAEQAQVGDRCLGSL
ncbi:MAG: hypothetical protein H6Q03_2137, partial [Acidobacteria bacterium]|nr:hypothetical protein [Acidobacteriota bacterium]